MCHLYMVVFELNFTYTFYDKNLQVAFYLIILNLIIRNYFTYYAVTLIPR